MDEPLITRAEFERRLVALCLSGGAPGMPRRPRDRRILLRSVVLGWHPGGSLTEPEINELLSLWLAGPGRTLELDHVSLRRELVDAGFLVRDAAGEAYRLRPEGLGAAPFTADVAGVDPEAVLEAARAEAEARRRAHAGPPAHGSAPAGFRGGPPGE